MAGYIYPAIPLSGRGTLYSRKGTFVSVVRNIIVLIKPKSDVYVP